MEQYSIKIDDVTKKVILLLIAFLLIVFVVSKFKKEVVHQKGIHFKYSEYPGQWPFTVPEMWVVNIDGQVIGITPNGKRYPLNGTAKTFCSDCSELEDVWRIDPKPLEYEFYSLKKSQGKLNKMNSVSPTRIMYTDMIQAALSESFSTNSKEIKYISTEVFPKSFLLTLKEQEAILGMLRALESLRIASKNGFSNTQDAAQAIRNLEESYSLAYGYITSDSLKWIIPLFQKALSNGQKALFRNARKTFANDLAVGLWKEDVEVKHNDKRLTFIGAKYARNQNKLDDFNTLKFSLEKFRFKEVVFKWYDYDESPTLFTVVGKNDNEL